MQGEVGVAAGRAERGFDTFGVLAKFAPLIFLVVLMAAFAVVSPRFLTPLNLFNVMRQVSIYGILAVGMTFVILTRGIDLSVGSLVALAGLAAAIVAKGGLREPLRRRRGGRGARLGLVTCALVAALAVGTVAGWLQGFAITRLKVPPFVVTLGGMSAFRGAALLLAGGGPISGFDPAYRWWGQGYLGPVPVPVIVFLAIARDRPRRADATRASGAACTRSAAIPRPRASPASTSTGSRPRVYVIIGFLAGLGGFVLSARLNSSEAVAGTGLRAHRHRLGRDRRHLASSAASARSSAPSSARS